MLTKTTRLAVLFAPFLLAALPPDAPAQNAQTKRLERLEQKFQNALATRDAAWDSLVEDYAKTEAWFLDTNLPTPNTIRAWIAADGEPLPDQDPRQEWRERAFHEFWNKALYKISKPARAFSKAAKELERSFHALERLRHPERYAHGADKVPLGMVLVPARRIQVPPSEGYLFGHSKHQQQRLLRSRAFYLDRDEVTAADFARFLLALPLALREEHLPADWTFGEKGEPLFPSGQGRDPVTGISWISANRYAEWRGKRLPTEDEWLTAALGRSGRKYPHGDRMSGSEVNFLGSLTHEAQPAAAFLEDVTPLGVRGMSGNVREWTRDLYVESGSRNRATSVREPGPTTLAVVKGGSFQDSAESCRSLFRWLFPAMDARLPYIGFRCAQDVK